MLNFLLIWIFKSYKEESRQEQISTWWIFQRARFMCSRDVIPSEDIQLHLLWLYLLFIPMQFSSSTHLITTPVLQRISHPRVPFSLYGVNQQLCGPHFTHFWPTIPSSWQLCTFYIIPTLSSPDFSTDHLITSFCPRSYWMSHIYVLETGSL